MGLADDLLQAIDLMLRNSSFSVDPEASGNPSFYRLSRGPKMLKTLSLCLVFSCVFKTLSLARNREGSTMGVSVEQTLRFFAILFVFEICS